VKFTFARYALPLLLIVSISASAQTGKPKVGVLNFQSSQQDSMLAIQANVALMSALVGSGKLEVLDHSTMVQDFLSGTARQHAERERFLETLRGESCNETQCLIDIGFALETRYMVAGTVSRWQNSTTIAVRLVDVSTTSILAYPSETVQGDPIASLATSARAIAEDIVQALPGEVYLVGLPDDATIWIDNVETTWRPERQLPITPGRHNIRAERSGFFGVTKRVDVEYGEPKYVHFKLRQFSRGGATLRSLMLPGWGQIYSDRKIRGALYLALEAGAIGALGFAIQQSNSANTAYDVAKLEYFGLTAGHPDHEFISKRKAMVDKWDDVQSARNVGYASLAALALVHVVSALDATVGFPDLASVRIVERPHGGKTTERNIAIALSLGF
jgi:TolB-like protein